MIKTQVIMTCALFILSNLISVIGALASEKPLLTTDDAIQVVLDVAQEWPSDISELRDIVSVDSDYVWMEQPTWPPVGISLHPDDPWHGILFEWQGKTADQPAMYGRKISCIRLGNTSIEKIRDKITNNDTQRSDNVFSAGEFHAVAFFMAEVPTNAIAAQMCELTIFATPEFDPAQNTTLNNKFDKVGSPDPALDAQLQTLDLNAKNAFAATKWNGKNQTHIDHIVGKNFQAENGDATALVITFTSWLKHVAS